MTKALYAGTFDPPTFGHLDLVARGARLFDHLVVAVAENSSKAPLLSSAERVLLEFQLGVARARADRAQALAEVERLSGVSLHRED